jgi:hypothetical protein
MENGSQKSEAVGCVMKNTNANGAQEVAVGYKELETRTRNNVGRRKRS